MDLMRIQTVLRVMHNESDSDSPPFTEFTLTGRDLVGSFEPRIKGKSSRSGIKRNVITSIRRFGMPNFGPLAHREEQGTFNPKVPGSRPGRPTVSCIVPADLSQISNG